jgi:hypothetical protein
MVDFAAQLQNADSSIAPGASLRFNCIAQPKDRRDQLLQRLPYYPSRVQES